MILRAHSLGPGHDQRSQIIGVRSVTSTTDMGLGILEDRHLEHVPGTATLDELDEVAAAARHEHDGRRELKKSSNGTILVPQPSDDPNGMLKP